MHSTLYESTELDASSLSSWPKKSGTSLAEDVVRTVEGILLSYNVDYSNITCIVTDTEARKQQEFLLPMLNGQLHRLVGMAALTIF
jgi:hypothetical protein